MPKTEPFDKYIDQYEDWFVQNRYAYQSELEAVRRHLPAQGKGLEIGVGSGLFAEPLGISHGIEPSAEMRKLAVKRGIHVIHGVAEKLPVGDHLYDYAVMVTTICFLDDVLVALQESRRILRPGGKLIIGFVDRNSPIGQLYQKHKDENVFYREARFYSVDQVTAYMKLAGFYEFFYTQTIFSMLDEISKPEEIKEGYGEGSFVVISGINKNQGRR